MKWSYISVLKSHKCANIKSYQCKVFCTGSYELYLNLNLQIVFKLLAKTSNHNLECTLLRAFALKLSTYAIILHDSVLSYNS